MKKKKDGLIKGMIAAAIIFVVGFILTVCFGVYLGADAVRHIASGETFEEFVEERFPNIGFDDGQTVNESQTEKCHGADSAFMQIRENRDGQCSTLRRVSSGAELVKQNQGMTVCFSKKRDDICHVGRKGT